MACGKESRSTGYSHIFDLAQPAQRWKRFSVNAYNGNKVPPTGACAYDSKRNCVWQFVHGNAIVGKLDVAAKTWTNYPMAQGMGDLRPDSLTAQYYAPRDIVVLWAYRRTTPKSTGVWVFNPNNPTAGVQRITLTLPIPPSTTSEVIGGDICTHNGRLYLITPADEDAVFEVTIGGDRDLDGAQAALGGLRRRCVGDWLGHRSGGVHLQAFRLLLEGALLRLYPGAQRSRVRFPSAGRVSLI